MLRRDFLSTLPFAFAPPGGRPNVLFILADDQRYDHLGATGHPIVQTPHIDALAARGSLFTHAFATSPVCTPSRTSILLGQWERRHGINFNSGTAVDPRAFANSYPMLLKAAGYFTGYVGKNHTPVGRGGYKSGHLEESFDYWYGNHNHTLFYPKERHPIYRNAKASTQPEVLLEGAANFLTPEDGFLSGARQFLKQRPAGRPFYLSVCFNLPHSAGTGSMELRADDPELYRTRYRDRAADFRPPKTYVAAKDIREPKIPRHVYNGEYIPSYNFVKTPEALTERQIRTCQAITGIDNLVGSLVAQLKSLGLDRNTIIVYSSDHGLHFGEHGLGGKVLLYEESVRIPLIVYDPRLPRQRRRVDEMAVTADLGPAMLDLCGLKPPASMQGRSLAPLLTSPAAGWRQDVFLENLFTNQNYPRAEAVRGKDWKYIRYFQRTPEGGAEPYPYAETLEASINGEQPVYEELYHLAADPYEERNLAGDARHLAKLKELRARCGQLAREAKGGPAPPAVVPL